jgi:hypothetical protein
MSVPVGAIERTALGLHTASRAQATIDRPFGTDVSSLPFPGTSYRATIKCPSGDVNGPSESASESIKSVRAKRSRTTARTP